ncbi:MAG TPA: hypothetical protein VK447_15475 [Myxococcaceae bacterium]|nr:hypothetical protein [Myxococcaceae bacterium]
MRGVVVLAPVLALFTSAASAQPFGPDTRLLMPDGPLRGSPRIMGLGGAFTGLADGAEGVIRNFAAIAHGDPRATSELSADAGFALHFLPPWAARDSDWDNDGLRDARPGALTGFLGQQVVYGVGTLRYRWVGLALGIDAQNFVSETPLGGFNLSLFHLFGGVGVSLLDGALLLGAGVESTHGVFAYLENRGLKDTAHYRGFGFTAGVLWRPANADYRAGLSFHSVGNAPLLRGNEEMGGYVLPGGVVSPARVSVGGSVALGEGGLRLNSTGPNRSTPGKPEPRFTRWLVSAQVDVSLPVRGAATVDAFLGQHERAPLAAGNQPTVTPRLGAERELLEGLFRLRAGTYLEPALVPTGQPRPHLTFGYEAFLFWIAGIPVGFGLSLDLARDYKNLSAGFELWR